MVPIAVGVDNDALVTVGMDEGSSLAVGTDEDSPLAVGMGKLGLSTCFQNG